MQLKTPVRQRRGWTETVESQEKGDKTAEWDSLVSSIATAVALHVAVTWFAGITESLNHTVFSECWAVREAMSVPTCKNIWTWYRDFSVVRQTENRKSLVSWSSTSLNIDESSWKISHDLLQVKVISITVTEGRKRLQSLDWTTKISPRWQQATLAQACY